MEASARSTDSIEPLHPPAVNAKFCWRESLFNLKSSLDGDAEQRRIFSHSIDWNEMADDLSHRSRRNVQPLGHGAAPPVRHRCRRLCSLLECFRDVRRDELFDRRSNHACSVVSAVHLSHD